MDGRIDHIGFHLGLERGECGGFQWRMHQSDGKLKCSSQWCLIMNGGKVAGVIEISKSMWLSEVAGGMLLL